MSDDLEFRPHREPPHDAPAPTRIWPSVVLGLFAPVITSMFAVIFLWDWIAMTGSEEELRADQALNLAGSLLTQIGTLLLCILVAFRSPLGPEERSGLQPPRGTWWVLAILALATFGSSIVTDFVLSWAGMEAPKEAVELSGLLQTSQGMERVLWCISGIIGAPVAEELLYRGIVLRGMLRRLSPWVAIIFVAGCFAVAHGSWEYQAAIFPGALMLGWLAYRTRSVWPGIAAHFLVNLYGVSADLVQEPLRTQIFAAPGVPSVFEIAGLIALPIGIWMLIAPERFGLYAAPRTPQVSGEA